MNKNNQHNAQLFRFCLYGFLKNQVYFEPFLILAFLEKGLSFLQIGFLISFKAISVNFMEIPSGGVADVWGRRRSMIFSMAGYIVSFAIFATATVYWMFFPAMLLFAIGDAFRTGTHKAMIFDWLEHYGREKEKTKIYGFTRSWSKIGSALSVIIATGVVFLTGSYIWLFWLAIIPYLLNVLNFTMYPAFLDPSHDSDRSFKKVFSTLVDGIRLCAQRKPVRNIIIENICFEGFFGVAKDYLQPLIKAAALSSSLLLSLSGERRTALLVAVIYVILNLLSSYASRKSHWIVEKAGNENSLSTWILSIAFIAYILAAIGLGAGISVIAIGAFILLYLLLNVWKPVFVSRFYELAEKQSAATTLSISNQSKSLAVVVIAPLLGWTVDHFHKGNTQLESLLPVACFGIFFGITGLLIHLRNRH